MTGAIDCAHFYYPVDTRILISDNNNTLAILTDRSEGGSSLYDGQVELMIHRRDFFDDKFGVHEALDEPGRDGRGLVVREKHWLILSPVADISKLHRTLVYNLYHQSVMTFSKYSSIADYSNNFATQYSGLNTQLPPQINLVTLKQLDNQSLLVRFEHFYQKSEDPTVVQVDLSNLFQGLTVVSAQEWNLQVTEVRQNLTDMKVSLNPMEIKAYVLQAHKN